MCDIMKNAWHMAGGGGSCWQHECWGHDTWGETDRLFGLPIGVSPTQVWRVWVHRQFQVVLPLSLPFSSLYSEVSRWFL